jgi:hypothetical protein
MRFYLGSIPMAQRSEMNEKASVRNSIDVRTSCSMRGLCTLSESCLGSLQMRPLRRSRKPELRASRAPRALSRHTHASASTSTKGSITLFENRPEHEPASSNVLDRHRSSKQTAIPGKFLTRIKEDKDGTVRGRR